MCPENGTPAGCRIESQKGHRRKMKGIFKPIMSKNVEGRRGNEMKGFFGNMFDFNRDGELSVLEKAAELTFLGELLHEEEEDNLWDSDEKDSDY